MSSEAQLKDVGETESSGGDRCYGRNGDNLESRHREIGVETSSSHKISKQVAISIV